MTPPTLREICERASKRRVGHDTAMCDALVDMHARLSPDTVLAVIDALEINASQGCDYSRDALAALNRTP